VSEWQPARLFHKPHENYFGEEKLNKELLSDLTRKVIYVQPIDLNFVDPITIEEYTRAGCSCEKFWLIRDMNRVACEHEILTD
jgi:hypothetical protein